MSGGLLERGDELDAMLAAVDAATAGSGRVVVVLGEAGIGKTTVVRALLDQLAPPVRILRGVCDDLLAPRPLGPLQEAVRGGSGPLAQALRAPPPAEGVFGAVVAELAARRPTVLVLEDVHWADDATLDVLRYLGRRIETLPALLLLTVREDAASSAARQLLGALTGPDVVRLPLGPLSRAAVADLARLVGRDGAALHALTGGNPFFLTEVLAAGPDALPASVADAVRSRLRPLDPACVAALDQLSVVPGVVEFALAEALLEDRIDLLAQAEEHGIIEVHDAGLAFRHELARRAVEAALPGLRRRALNLAVVRVLRQAAEPDLERLVHHAVAADDPATIVEFAPRAGRAAAAAGSHRQALAHLEAAVRHLDRLPLHEQARLLDDYGWELHIAHRFPAALAAAQDAVGRYERVGDPVPLGEAVVRLSRHVYMDGDTDGAERLVQRAVDILRAAGQAEALAAAATSRAALLTLTGQLTEAVPALEDALRLARAAARPELESLCLNYLGLSRAERGGGAGEAELREALAVAQAADCHEAAARAHLNLSDLLHALGRWDDFDIAVTDGQAFAREHGLWQHVFVMELHRHMLLVYRGEWDTAEQGLRQLVEQADAGMLDLHRLHPYGRLLARRGRSQARELLDRAWGRAVQQRAPLGLARAGIGLVELAWLTGCPDRAREVGDVLLPRMRAPGWAYMRGELACYLALAGVPPDPLPECAEPWAAGLRGDWRAAAAGWERERGPYERALALAGSGLAEPTLEALRVLDELGATAPAAIVRRRLRGLGVTPPRRRTAEPDPAGLTDREVEVLELVADGATNADIAARLGLSVRTVDHHVSAILSKLGARSRREAVAAARSRSAGISR